MHARLVFDWLLLENNFGIRYFPVSNCFIAKWDTLCCFLSILSALLEFLSRGAILFLNAAFVLNTQWGLRLKLFSRWKSTAPVQCTDKEPGVLPGRALERQSFSFKNISGLQLKRVYMVYEKEDKWSTRQPDTLNLTPKITRKWTLNPFLST